MKTCVIVNNMIIKDERGQPEKFNYDYNGLQVQPEYQANRVQRFLEAHHMIGRREAHDNLEMILWSTCGNFIVLDSYAFIMFYLDYLLHSGPMLCLNLNV